MYAVWIDKIKRIFPAVVLILCMAFFLFQTASALSIVALHAELFEKKGTVVIDAGHGGDDGGAVGINGVLEKDINLSISLKLQKLLQANNFEVIMIRDEDYAVGDTGLPTVAQRKRSDTISRLETVREAGECIYIGIHQNYFSESKYSGAQIFYSPNNEESARLAEFIRCSIVNSTQPDNKRENKAAEKNIYILYNAEVPAVFVECGFISNPQEAEKLSNDAYQDGIARAIYNGLIEYFKACNEER